MARLTELDKAIGEDVTPNKAKTIQNTIIRPMMDKLKSYIATDIKKPTADEKQLYEHYRNRIKDLYNITYNKGFIFSQKNLESLHEGYGNEDPEIRFKVFEESKDVNDSIEGGQTPEVNSQQDTIDIPQTDDSPTDQDQIARLDEPLNSEMLIDQVDDDEKRQLRDELDKQRQLLEEADHRKAKLIKYLTKANEQLRDLRFTHEDEVTKLRDKIDVYEDPDYIEHDHNEVADKLLSNLDTYVKELPSHKNTSDTDVKKEIQKICKQAISDYRKTGGDYNELLSKGSLKLSTHVNSKFRDKFTITLRPNYNKDKSKITSVGVTVNPGFEVQAEKRKLRKLKKLNHEEKRDYTESVNHDKPYHLDIESIVQAVIRYIMTRIRNMKNVSRPQIIEIISKLIDNNNDSCGQTFQLSKQDMSRIVDLFMDSYDKDSYTYNLSSENRDKIYQIFKDSITRYSVAFCG